MKNAEAINAVMNGLKNSKTQRDAQSQTRKLKPSYFTQAKTKNEAFEKCKATCQGPQNCPFNGTLFYMPSAKSLYGPYAFDCPIYKKWRKQLELEKRVMESIPKKFWDRTFQNFEAVSEDLALALNITKKYVAKRAWEKGANIVISGKYGVGKTHLAASVIHEAIKLNFNAVFITAPSLVNGSINDIRDKFQEIKQIELIALDDFSIETSHKMIAKEMFELINYRYESEKGMVMTTNLSAVELKESLGDRIFDRMQERTVIIKIADVESYRKKKRREYISWMEE